jgi:hypothetical protein
MFEDQIKSLFSSEEYASFLKYMEKEHYFWEKNKFCHSGYILGFISQMEDDSRRNNIIEICTNSYPQIVGLAPGN